MRHPLASSLLLTALASPALVSTQVLATDLSYGQGDFYTRMGVAKVVPESDNGNLASGSLSADVDSDSGFAFTLGYRFTDKLGIELLGAQEFDHNINLKGADGSSINASTSELPPTLFLQYYPMGGMQSRIQPYVGIGVNYTAFSDEKISVDGADLELDDSWGAAGQVGLDLVIDEHWAVNASATYADIDSDVSLNGDDIGSVDIDPWVIMSGVSFRF
uniref:OmpW/AlkL family protein n=1 Tax=Halomonas sp. TaxID=1486246 RepID=UPI00261702E2|nr:OmpW family outer membrane protein [Halomonas sp.]